MGRSRRRRVAIVAIASVVTAACIALGFWQLQRLADRRALNAEIRDRAIGTPHRGWVRGRHPDPVGLPHRRRRGHLRRRGRGAPVRTIARGRTGAPRRHATRAGRRLRGAGRPRLGAVLDRERSRPRGRPDGSGRGRRGLARRAGEPRAEQAGRQRHHPNAGHLGDRRSSPLRARRRSRSSSETRIHRPRHCRYRSRSRSSPRDRTCPTRSNGSRSRPSPPSVRSSSSAAIGDRLPQTP